MLVINIIEKRKICTSYTFYKSLLFSVFVAMELAAC